MRPPAAAQRKEGTWKSCRYAFSFPNPFLTPLTSPAFAQGHTNTDDDNARYLVDRSAAVAAEEKVRELEEELDWYKGDYETNKTCMQHTHSYII